MLMINIRQHGYALKVIQICNKTERGSMLRMGQGVRRTDSTPISSRPKWNETTRIQIWQQRQTTLKKTKHKTETNINCTEVGLPT